MGPEAAEPVGPRSILILNQFFHPENAATAFLATDLARHWASRGHRVEVLCGRSSYAAKGSRRSPRRETWNGIRIRRVYSLAGGKSSTLRRVLDYASFYVSALLAALTRRRVDLVVSLTTPPFLYCVALVHRLLWRSRVWLWSMDVYPEVAIELGALRRRGLLAALLRAVNRAGLPRVDLAVALDSDMEQVLSAAGARRTTVIQNWTRKETYAPLGPDERRRVRAEHGIRDGDLLVLYLGNMGMGHEFDTILEAAATLRREGLPVRVLFVGGGQRAGEVERKVRERSLDNVQLAGYVPVEQARLLAGAADVGLISQRASMVGLITPSKLYALLSMAVPILFIGPARSEMGRVVREGTCGRQLEIGDAAGVTTFLREALAERDELQRSGQRGRRLFLERYEYRRAMERFDAALDRTCAGARSRNPAPGRVDVRH